MLVAVVLLLLALILGAIATFRARAGRGAALFALPAGAVLLAALAFALLGHGNGNAAAASLNGQWLAAPPDFSLVTAFGPTGQVQYLNAGVTPLLFVSVRSDKAATQAIAARYLRLGLYKKPLVILATDLGTASLQSAARETQAFAKDDELPLAWAMQAGPPQEYVQATPALVYVAPGSAAPTIVTGTSAIEAALSRAVTLPRPAVLHLKKAGGRK